MIDKLLQLLMLFGLAFGFGSMLWFLYWLVFGERDDAR